MDYYDLNINNTVNLILGLIDIKKHNPDFEESTLPKGATHEYKYSKGSIDVNTVTGATLLDTYSFERGVARMVGGQDARKMLFDIEETLEELLPLDDSIRTHWNSQLNSYDVEALFWNKQADKVILVTSDKKDVKVSYYTEYPYSEKLLNTIVENWMIRERGRHLNNGADLVVGLKDLWLIQSKKVGTVKFESESNRGTSVFLDLLSKVVLDSGAKSSRSGLREVTFENVVDFYLEVQKGSLTQKSAPVQDWLTAITDDAALGSLLDVISLHENYDNIAHAVTRASETERSDIYDTLLTDEHVSDHLKVLDVYKVNLEPSESAKKKKHHLTALHGTLTKSVPSILLNGLRTTTELEEMNNNNYDYTGSGLGDGVYFAYPEQASKPLNYSRGSGGSGEVTFLFMADLAYDTTASYDTFVGNQADQKVDLVIGNHVGARGISELVMHNSEDITIKYVLVVRK